MSAPSDGSSGPVRPAVALGLTVVGFIALLIAALGVTSLALNTDVVTAAGLGVLPGSLGLVGAAAAFAAGLWVSIRRPEPSFWGALWIAAATLLAYLAGLALGAGIAGADPAVAVGAAGRVATSAYGVVVALTALVAAWAGIALVRTRAGRPHWPWERDDE